MRHAVRRCAGLTSGSTSNEMRQDRMVTLAALDGLRWCITAPSSKAGNDCDAFFSTMDGDKEPIGIFS